MKKGKLLGAIMALTLLGTTAAMADGYYERDHNGNMVYNRADDRYYRDHPSNQSFRHGMHYRNRWVRGNRFPRQYRQNQYVVTDWQTRQLRAPPRGYRWYRADDQYVLVRNSNGVIGDILNALR